MNKISLIFRDKKKYCLKFKVEKVNSEDTGFNRNNVGLCIYDGTASYEIYDEDVDNAKAFLLEYYRKKLMKERKNYEDEIKIIEKQFKRIEKSKI